MMTRDAATEKTRCVDAFMAGTRELLETMASAETGPGRVCRWAEAGISTEAAAVMPVTGRRSGLVAVATALKTARGIVAGMTGRLVGEVDDRTAREGMKEVLNIIAGSAKSRLAGQPCHFMLTVPEVWAGDAEALAAEAGVELTAMVFELDGALFASGFALAGE